MSRHHPLRPHALLLLLIASLICSTARAQVDLNLLASRIEKSCGHPKASSFYLAVVRAIIQNTLLNRQTLEDWSKPNESISPATCDFAVLQGKNDVLLDALQHPAQASMPHHMLEGILAIVRLKILTLQGPPFPKAGEDDVRRLITASVNDTRAYIAKTGIADLKPYGSIEMSIDFDFEGTPAQQIYWLGFLTPYYEADFDERKKAGALANYEMTGGVPNELHERLMAANWLYHVETRDLPNREQVLRADIEQQQAWLAKLGQTPEQKNAPPDYLNEPTLTRSLAFSYAALGDVRQTERWIDKTRHSEYYDCFHKHMISLVADKLLRQDPGWYQGNFEKACSSIINDDSILRQFTAAPTLAANLEKACSPDMPVEYMMLQEYMAEEHHYDFSLYTAIDTGAMPPTNSYSPIPLNKACVRAVLESSRTILTFYHDHMPLTAYSYSSFAEDKKDIEDGLTRLSSLE